MGQNIFHISSKYRKNYEFYKTDEFGQMDGQTEIDLESDSERGIYLSVACIRTKLMQPCTAFDAGYKKNQVQI